MKTGISKTFIFDMAHRLTFHDGQCRNVHGHTYSLEIFLEGKPDRNGIIMDYADLKKIVKDNILDKLDHSLAIYEYDTLLIGKLDPNLKQVIFPFETTAENLVRWIFDKLHKLDSRVKKAELWETRNNRAVCTL